MKANEQVEDLPQEYIGSLTEKNLVPLWPSLRALLPPGIPERKTEFAHWSYSMIRPLLMRAGDLTPIEKAERRVLVLANPGHGLEAMKISPAMYAGMQLLLPGECAPSHRHTPNAVRMIVEGDGAYTTVDGEKLPMERGDLILTPSGRWHEHGHDGVEPVIWLDILDLPLIYYMETSYHTDGQHQTAQWSQREKAYTSAGVLPTLIPSQSDERYPLLRYSWVKVREALLALSTTLSEKEAVQVTYVNPHTGEHAENTLGFYALMLRPGQDLTLPARSPSCLFHIIEGHAEISTQARSFVLAEADTACVPGYTPTRLRNLEAHQPTFIFMADETPLHQKIGVHEVR